MEEPNGNADTSALNAEGTIADNSEPLDNFSEDSLSNDHLLDGIDLGWEEKPEPVKEEKPQEAKDDPKRFQYWQSQHDRIKVELDKVMPEYEELKIYAPIARYIQSNPQILKALEEQLKTGGNFTGPIQPQGTAQTGENLPVRPKKPVKPDNYSPYEATSDPASESAKYMEAYIKYQEELSDYMARSQEDFERKQKDIADRQVRDTEMARRRLQLQEELHYKYNLAPGEVKEFIQEMSDPKSASLENLVEFYRFKKQLKSGPVKPQKKAPPPNGVGGGASNPNMDENDMFNMDLIRYAKGRF